MKVKLIAHTEVTDDAFPMNWQPASSDAEHLITGAGRQCYVSFHRPNEKTYEDADYIRRTLIEQAHWSVAEHASVSFRIEGISRNCLLELERHRQFSYSVVSQRYVNMDDVAMVIPPLFRGDEYAEDLINEHLMDARKLYQQLAARAEGLHKAKRKEAREAAREVLPGGVETTLVLSGNHRAFREMLTKRYHQAAAAEIRELATELLRQLREIAPAVYADFPEVPFS